MLDWIYMVKFRDVFTKTDWVKIAILLIVAIICWTWVWREYQKPITPPQWQQQWEEESLQ